MMKMNLLVPRRKNTKNISIIQKSPNTKKRGADQKAKVEAEEDQNPNPNLDQDQGLNPIEDREAYLEAETNQKKSK